MKTTLRIDNFRSFRRLTVEGLTRVSLLVGTNNSGKTSVLEVWDAVVLTPEEAKVTNALQIIEPDIERLAALSGSQMGGTCSSSSQALTNASPWKAWEKASSGSSP